MSMVWFDPYTVLFTGHSPGSGVLPSGAVPKAVSFLKDCHLANSFSHPPMQQY